MKKILTIAKKEWSGYVGGVAGYVFAGLLLAVVNWLFWSDLFLMGQADMGPYWSVMAFVLIIFMPALSMGLMAEEKKSGTWELVLSLPIDEAELVLGKFLGSACFLLLVMALTIPTALTLYWLGSPDGGVIISSYLGVIFLGLGYLSTGLLVSTATNQPMVAFLVTVAVFLINNLMGQEFFLMRLPGIIGRTVESLSLSWRAGHFNNGLISIQDGVFFISWITIMLISTILILKNRGK